MAYLAEMGSGPVPTAAFLDDLARKIRDKPEGRGWVCPGCKHRNDLVDNLLFKLPPFKCSNPEIDCHVKCPATPEMCISDCVVNNVRTDFLIRNQGGHPTCTAHALLHGMDGQLRVYGALYGKIVAQPLNGVDLLGKYRKKVGKPLGEEKETGQKQKRTVCLLQIAQSEGVEYIAPEGSVKTGRVLRLRYWFYLSTQGDINFLIRLIASGFPLLTGMRTGRCFKMSNHGELYLSPKLPPNHSVVLIGCCVKPMWLPTEDGSSCKLIEDVLFKARDSKGEKVHTSGQHVGTGGDIYLLAEDLGSYVFGFQVELPAWMRPVTSSGTN